MKTILTALCLGCVHFVSYTQNREIKINSTIEKVTIFQTGAQITRNAGFQCKPGDHILVISSLSDNINPDAIQLKGIGNFNITGVKYRLNYLADPEVQKDFKKISDSIRWIEKLIKIEKNATEVLKSDEEFLIANRKIGGDNNGLNLAELKNISEFVHQKYTEIKRKQLETEEKTENLQQIASKLKKQLNQLQQGQNKQVGEIVINVNCKEQNAGKILISYFANNTSWQPLYELKANDLNKPVELLYKGIVNQNTGENWQNVTLTLSSGNPALTNQKPELMPWYIDFKAIQQLRGKSYNYGMLKKQDLTGSAASVSNFNIEESLTSNEFVADQQYSLMSENIPTVIEITKYDLPASFQYFSAPKLEPTAFLNATITNWQHLGLLPGNIQIFQSDSYIGSAWLEPNSLNDTLNLSLGRDEAVRIERKEILQYTSKKTLSGKIQEQKQYEIRIKNNKKNPIKIQVEENVPISRNADLNVQILESSDAQINKETGILKWLLELNSMEEKTLKISYLIEYPKNQSIDWMPD